MMKRSVFTENDAFTMWKYTEDHLRNWGFEDLIAKFRDKNLTFDVLEVLTLNELGDLILDIARRSAFWRKFQSWNEDFKKVKKSRQSSPLVKFRAIADPELNDLDTRVSQIMIGNPEMSILEKMIASRPTSSPNISVKSDEPEEECAQQLQVMTTPDADVAGCLSTPSRTRQVLVNPEIGRPVASQTPDAHKTDDTALKDILKASTEGKALLVQGMSLGALPSDMHRRMLSRLVVNHLLSDDPERSVGLHVWLRLAYEVVSLFPKEDGTHFYVKYTPGNPFQSKKTHKGFFINAYYGHKSKMRTLGLISNKRRSLTTSSRHPID